MITHTCQYGSQYASGYNLTLKMQKKRMNHEQVFVHVNSHGSLSRDQLFAWNYILQRREVDAEVEAVADDYIRDELMYCVFLLTDFIIVA